MSTELAQPAKRLYEFVRARVVERLRSGHWAPGDRIPTEAQLAAEFGVGIGTIRRAVEELVAEGVLVRRARLGTTVARHGDSHDFDLYFSFVDRAGGAVRLSARLLALKTVRAPAEVADALRLDAKARVVQVENLRLLGAAPAMLDRIWLPLGRFPDLRAEAFAARPGSIYGFYQARYGITVVRVVEDLGAGLADPIAARALGIEPGAPLLRVRRTAFTYGDAPVECRLRLVDPAVCEYRNARGLQD